MTPRTAVPDPATHPLRLMLARWLGIYPAITLLLLALGPLLFRHLPIYPITLLLTATLVPLTHYAVFPLVEKLLGGWVRFPAQHGAAQHRTALVIWVATYPLITLVLLTVLHVAPAETSLPLLALAVTVVAVPLQSLVLLPAVLPRARGWIAGSN